MYFIVGLYNMSALNAAIGTKNSQRDSSGQEVNAPHNITLRR